jgi:hypothetical protein
MTVSESLAVMLAVIDNKKPRANRSRHLIFPVTTGFSRWLGCRDSNPNYLIQSQASYR